MKLWRVGKDKERVPVMVEGEPYPGKDQDGLTCFVNTHFEQVEDAWRELLLQRKAAQTIAAVNVAQRASALEVAEQVLCDAATERTAVEAAFSMWEKA